MSKQDSKGKVQLSPGQVARIYHGGRADGKRESAKIYQAKALMSLKQAQSKIIEKSVPIFAKYAEETHGIKNRIKRIEIRVAEDQDYINQPRGVFSFFKDMNSMARANTRAKMNRSSLNSLKVQLSKYPEHLRGEIAAIGVSLNHINTKASLNKKIGVAKSGKYMALGAAAIGAAMLTYYVAKKINAKINIKKANELARNKDISYINLHQSEKVDFGYNRNF